MKEDDNMDKQERERYKDLIEDKIDSRDIYDGKLLHVKCDRVKLPDGKEAMREWIKHPGAAAVVPLFADGNILMVRQFRYPVDSVTLEIPAGKLDAQGEDPLICAKRELSEETGYSANAWEKLTTIATTVGFSDEYIHLYLAKDLAPGKQHPDSDEFINAVKMPLKEAVDMIYRGEIIDAKTIIAILMTAKHESA